MTNLADINLPWTESPFFEKELKEANLGLVLTEQIRKYAEDGYLIFDPEISESVLNEAIKGTNPLYGKNIRIMNAWEDVPAVQQIATAPKIMEILRLLYRREPIPFQTLNFLIGTQQRTHSDSVHFNSIPQRFMCGVWVALEDTRDDNGPLYYYPGSHKLPFYDLIDLGIKGPNKLTVLLDRLYGTVYQQYEDRLEAIVQAQGLKRVTLNIPKGKAIIWSSNLLHGGDKIQTAGLTRHSQVTHYFFEDCAYYTPIRSNAVGSYYFRTIRNIVTGKMVKSKYFGNVINSLHIPTKLLKFFRKMTK